MKHSFTAISIKILVHVVLSLSMILTPVLPGVQASAIIDPVEVSTEATALTKPTAQAEQKFWQQFKAKFKTWDENFLIQQVAMEANQAVEQSDDPYQIYLPLIMNNTGQTPVYGPDLSLTKSDGEVTVSPGDTLTYTIDYVNHSSTSATGVVLTESLPEYTSFDAASSTAGWQQVGISNQYTLNIGTLTGGATGTAIFALQLASEVPSTVTSITNTASITDDGSLGVDPNPANNTDSEVTPVNVEQAAPDLAISVSDGGVSVSPGELLVYQVSYSNNSLSDASGTSIQAELPENSSFSAESSSAGWTFNSIQSLYTFNLNTLAAGANGQINFAIVINETVPAGLETIVGSFEIKFDATLGSDPTPLDNTASTSTSLIAAPDLSIVISTESVYVQPGASLVFDITYANVGDQDATGVELYASLPDNTVFDPTNSTEGWVLVTETRASQYKLPVGILNALEHGLAKFAVLALEEMPPGIQTILLNAGVIDDGSNGDDPNEDNNEEDEETPYSEAPDLTLTKSGPESVFRGDELIYTISFANIGYNSASNIVISETVPENTSFNAGLSDPDWVRVGESDSYTYSVASLAKDENGEVVFAVSANLDIPTEVSEISNTATIADDGSQGADPDPANNSATESTALDYVDSPPDLAISVDDGGLSVLPGGTLTYQINYANYGDLLATGVLIWADLPLYTSFDALNSDPAWVFVEAESAYELSLTSLEPDASGQVAFAVSVVDPAPSGLDEILGAFEISEDGVQGTDPDLSNNSAQTNTLVNAAPDLSISAAADLPLVQPGDAIVYDLSYANIGNQDASTVIISASVPEHTLFDAATSSSGWTLNTVSNLYDYQAGTLNAAAEGKLVFAVTVEATAAPSLTSIVANFNITDDTTNGPDPNPGNNADSVSVAYSEAPDLTLAKTGPGTVQPGMTLSYTLSYSNIGFNTASGIVITETLPENTSFDATSSAAGWTQVGSTNQYTYTISSLAKDASGEVLFAVTVAESIPAGTLGISNTAAIADDGSQSVDPDLSNNSTTYDSLFSTGPTTVCGAIAENTTWTPDKSPYILTCDVTVNSGIMLSILPGTIIKFNATSRRLIVNGVLNAAGSASSAIVFTSYKDDSVGGDSNGDGSTTSPAPGDWNTIQVNDTGSVNFSYAHLRYGGYSTTYYANLYLTQNAVASVENSLISNSKYYGIRINNTTSGKTSQLTISNSIIESNLNKGIYVYTASGGLSVVNVTGSIIQNNGNTGFETTNVLGLTFQNNQLLNNAGYAAYLNLSGNAAPDLTGVTGSGNSKNGVALVGPIAADSTLSYLPDLVYIIPSSGWTINAGVTMTIPAGQVVKGDNAGSELYIYGTLLTEGTPDNPITFTSIKDDSVGGDTNNDGSATTPAPGNWGHIYIQPGAIATMTHTDVLYGGYYQSGVIDLAGSGRLSLTSSRVAYSLTSGIYLHGGSGVTTILNVSGSTIEENNSNGIYTSSSSSYTYQVNITSSTIRNNGSNGVRISNHVNSHINNNNISSNSNYGVYNGSTTVKLDAEDNWWGDDDGPIPYPNATGNGINYNTCYDPYTGETYICEYYVDADPWEGKAYSISQDLINEELPMDPIRNTAPMEPGVPYIEYVTSQHGFFYFGEETSDLIEIRVDWNGSDEGRGIPGILLIKMNNASWGSKCFLGNEFGGNVYLNPSIFSEGHTDLKIQAISSVTSCNEINGVPSEIFVSRATKFSAPAWLIKMGFKNYPITVTIKPAYTEIKFNLKIPTELSEITFHQEGIPIMEKKIPNQLQTDVEALLRSDGYGEYSIKAKMAFGHGELSYDDVLRTASNYEVSAYIFYDGSGILQIPINGEDGSFTGIYSLGIGGEVAYEDSLLVLIPGIGPAIKSVGFIPGIDEIVRRIYYEYKLEPEIELSAGLMAYNNDPDLHWNGLGVNGKLKVTLTAGIKVLEKLIEMNIYGGGEIAPEFCLAPEPAWKRTKGALFAGAEIIVLDIFIRNPEARYEFEVSDPEVICVSESSNSELTLSKDNLKIIEGKTSDWRVNHPTYLENDYAKFESITTLSQSITEMNIRDVSDTLVISNLYKNAAPALTIDDTDAFMLWVHDDIALGDTQSKELMSSHWNGLTWSEPIQITNNMVVDYAPQIASINENHVVAVWQQINDPSIPDDATLTPEIGQKVELVYAIYDLQTGTWSNPAYLTNNTALDHRANLMVAHDGTLMVTWMQNTAGQLIGDSYSYDQIKYATWNGTSWVIGDVTATNISSLVSYDASIHSVSEGVIVFSKGKNGDLEDMTELELYYSEWDGTTWSEPVMLTSNTLVDESPSVNYTSLGEKRLIWLQENELMMLGDDWSLAPIPTQLVREGYLLRNFETAVDNEDNIALIWSGVADEGSDLFYSLYDAQSQTWLLAEQLTNSLAVEKQVSPSFDGSGQLMIAYALDNVAPETLERDGFFYNNVMTYQSTDLHVLHYTPDSDLSVSALSLPFRPNPEPGETVLVRANIVNIGDWPVENPSISFYDGDPALGGILISTYDHLGFVAAGTSIIAEVKWTVPADSTTSHTIFAVVDPDGLIDERDESNNQASLITILPDLTVSSVSSYYYDQNTVVSLAVIYNHGKLNAENILVEFREVTVDGPIVYSETIPLLEKESVVAVSTEIDVSAWVPGTYKYFVTIDSNDGILEVDEENNSDYFSIKVLPDLVIYAGDIITSIEEGIGGTVDVTLRNWGTTAGINITVNLYEGPEIDPNKAPLHTWTVPSLAVDGVTTLSTTVDHVPYHLFAVADPGDLIEEIDESNNVAFEELPVVHGSQVTVVGAADPNLQDIIAVPSGFDEGTGLFDVTVQALLFDASILTETANLCDISTLTDFTDINGKIVLVEKPTACIYDVQINNAASLGATAILVYNTLEGGNLREVMTGLPISIPAGFLARQDGLDLIASPIQLVMIASKDEEITILDPYR